ncbi:type III secretion system export apparatus subunit SctT [Thiolinea disciformis]|uniref:type III secretion system export apparatus subunit SctT n=1 Tax=Thiolinea disciformis TaxID=125614 RepID=UPI00037AF4C7|nr:type III secretion system export apparatus subunit SctT [Thiolinea disciformis]
MDIIGDFQTWYLALFLTSPRILVAFTVLPMFAQRIFPAMIRNGVMITVAMCIVPLTHGQVKDVTLNFPYIAFLVSKEAILGLMLGYMMSLPFWALRGAGFVMDMQRGAMSALFYSAPLSGMASPLANLFGQLAVAILFVSGGFLMLLEVLMQSYKLWPINEFIPTFNPEALKVILKQLDLLLYATLLISGPFLGIMFLIDFGLGLVGRYLPQMNIFTAAMPIKSALVFLILVIYISVIANYLRESFVGFGTQLHLLDTLLHERR